MRTLGLPQCEEPLLDRAPQTAFRFQAKRPSLKWLNLRCLLSSPIEEKRIFGDRILRHSLKWKRSPITTRVMGKSSLPETLPGTILSPHQVEPLLILLPSLAFQGFRQTERASLRPRPTSGRPWSSCWPVQGAIAGINQRSWSPGGQRLHLCPGMKGASQGSNDRPVRCGFHLRRRHPVAVDRNNFNLWRQQWVKPTLRQKVFSPGGENEEPEPERRKRRLEREPRVESEVRRRLRRGARVTLELGESEERVDSEEESVTIAGEEETYGSLLSGLSRCDICLRCSLNQTRPDANRFQDPQNLSVSHFHQHRGVRHPSTFNSGGMSLSTLLHLHRLPCQKTRQSPPICFMHLGWGRVRSRWGDDIYIQASLATTWPKILAAFLSKIWKVTKGMNLSMVTMNPSLIKIL